ncbi:MAG: hypothetical protein ACR2PQ_05845, partial [Myxococcota bacterium]
MSCALLPVVLFAAVSWNRVGEQLAEQSRSRLHQAARASGMRVVERLELLEEYLRGIGDAADVSERALLDRVEALGRLGADDSLRVLWGSPD